jgi:hypothetical protein
LTRLFISYFNWILIPYNWLVLSLVSVIFLISLVFLLHLITFLLGSFFLSSFSFVIFNFSMSSWFLVRLNVKASLTTHLRRVVQQWRMKTSNCSLHIPNRILLDLITHQYTRYIASISSISIIIMAAFKEIGKSKLIDWWESYLIHSSLKNRKSSSNLGLRLAFSVNDVHLNSLQLFKLKLEIIKKNHHIFSLLLFEKIFIVIFNF